MLTRFLQFQSIRCAAAPRRQLRFLTQNSHIEEEYFEEFEPSGHVSTSQKTLEDIAQKTLGFRRNHTSENGGVEEDVDFVENVVGALTKQRAKDVFVVRAEDKEMTPYTHKIVCSVFNSRQAAATSENIRSMLKIDGASDGIFTHAKKSTKRSNGWYVNEIERIQIHVMSEECREKYDLEAIWAGDDRILEEIDHEKQRILLPPKRVSN